MKSFDFLRRMAVLLLCLSLTGMGSCTTDYVTGKRTFSLVSESQEIEMGREADPAIVAEYGLYDDAELTEYVARLGQSLAKVSQRSQLTYTFRILDNPIVNAFALPGGYVYVTRGILAHFNSEDELAGVLGHEIGHVVARHGAEQMSRAQLAGLGLGLGSILSEDFAQFADLAGAGLGLLFLKFSRSQESESDMLGVEYSTRVGYNAHEMAGFFQTLKSMSDESGQSLPNFLSTHPDPGDRETKVHELAREWQAKVPYEPLNKSKHEYLQRIDGIVYGDDPQQGYVENNTFYHPKMRFQFPIPAGWNLVNTPSTVQMSSSDKKAAAQLTLGKTSSPEGEADDFVTKLKATVLSRKTVTVHGFNAVSLESQVKTDSNELKILSYFIQKDDKVFVFHGFTTVALFGNYRSSFTGVMSGFESVNAPAVINKKPKRLHIEKAAINGKFIEVMNAMGMPQDMLSELARINAREPGEQVQKGEWVKVVR
jgi:predicted Zn-dependent protease